MRRLSSLVAAAVTLGASTCFGSIIDESVVVGDSGNATDTRYAAPGFGAVDHTYGIGRYEVTAGQYTLFLNAVASDDLYGLYNLDMSTSEFGCKISRTGTPGAYSYSVAADRANRPVNFVSFWDAARYSNWLDNGQPSGMQVATTTEDGAYTLNGYMGGDGTGIGRNFDATWFIPTEDEWYKAAFYKGGNTNAGYWDYPTQTDLTPSNDLFDPDPGNNANFWQGGYSIGSPFYTTEVGEFENSSSAYGTFDQGGNLWEWNETVVSGTERGMRGGAFVMDSHEDLHLHASNRSNRLPSDELSSLGFRIGVVPEPSTALLVISGMFVVHRRRRCIR